MVASNIEEQINEAYRYVKKYVHKHIGSNNILYSFIDDIIQDSIIKIYRAIESRQVLNLRAFCYCVARNTVYDHAQKSRRTVSLNSNDDENGFPERINVLGAIDNIGNIDNRVDKIDNRDELEHILGLLVKLNNNNKNLIIFLQYLNGIPVKELSRIYNHSQKTIETCISRARKLIVEELIRRRKAA